MRHALQPRWRMVAVVGLLAMVAGFSIGCACDLEKDACYRYGLAGKGIIEDMPAPRTAGEKARLEAFKDAVDNCLKVGQR